MCTENVLDEDDIDTFICSIIPKLRKPTWEWIGLIWIKNAPIYRATMNTKVKKFVENYMS